MSKPIEYDYNATELLALTERAEQAFTNLKAAAIGLESLAGEPNGPKTLHVFETGMVDRSLKIVTKFARDVYDAWLDHKTGAVKRNGNAETPDTKRPKSSKHGQKSGVHRTQKDIKKST